jgi:hypothetical protein
VFKQRFLDFLPMFEGVAKENTPGRTPECALTIQIEPIIKTVTFGKEEQRVKALVTIFRKGATREFFGELLIHSYITGGLVDKEETAKFLHQLLLAPLICPPGKTN